MPHNLSTVSPSKRRIIPVKKRFLQSAVALVVALGALAGAAVPAQSAKWYGNDASCGTFFTLVCVTQWTGSYPTGTVRGFGQQNMYEVTLQTKTSHGGAWSTVARVYPQTSHTGITSAVRAGKWNYYRTCVRTVRGGTLWCLSNQGAVYLGD